MARPQPRPPSDPIPLHSKALEDLSFIRDTMARAGAVTSVPGWGGVAMGVTALGAAWIASRQATRAEWIAVWLAEAVVALGIGGLAMVRKADATHTPLFSRAGLLFVRAFVPPLLAGALLSAVFYRLGLAQVLPGLWLLLYGTAVTVAGAHSIRVVPLLGLSFMGLGGLAFLLPAAYGDWMMALGFGGLQIGFGLLIARKYGG